MNPDDHKGFCTFRNKGFHITFENGCTVSVQFGPGNYCQNRDDYDNLMVHDHTHYSSPDAEIAAWDKDGNWIRPGYEDWGDDVSGWRTPADVLTFMRYVADWR